jgi:hypothetical protein
MGSELFPLQLSYKHSPNPDSSSFSLFISFSFDPDDGCCQWINRSKNSSSSRIPTNEHTNEVIDVSIFPQTTTIFSPIQ